MRSRTRESEGSGRGRSTERLGLVRLSPFLRGTTTSTSTRRTLAHTAGPLPFPLSRVPRLLRPLRAALAHLELDLAEHRTSPFKQSARRRAHKAPTTYGSRRTARSAEPVHHHQPQQRKACLTTQDLAARLAAPSSGLAPPLQLRVLAALRAYANVLDAVSLHEPGDRQRVPSLAEIAARTLGWGIEDDVRACLAATSAGTDEDDDGTMDVPGGIEMDRSASMQELQLEAAQAQDEWYDACPPSAVRWLLVEHATAILVDALDAADAPFSIWESAFDLCLARGAHAEAARLHTPLVAALLALPRTPAPSSFLAVLARAPAPHALLHSALLPALLRSSFAQRFFFHPALSLPPRLLRGAQDAPAARAAADLVGILAVVAAAMLRAIAAATTEPDGDDVDPASARALQAEIRRRMLALSRAALSGALDVGGVWDQGTHALWCVKDAVRRVLAANHHHHADDDDDDDLADLRAVGAVCDVALALRTGSSTPSALPPPVVPAACVREADADALDWTLARFLPQLLASSAASNPGDAAAERLVVIASSGDAVDAVLGRAILRAIVSCRAVPAHLHDLAAARLAVAAGQGAEEEDGDEGAAETDYDGPFLPTVKRRRRRVGASPSPSLPRSPSPPFTDLCAPLVGRTAAAPSPRRGRTAPRRPPSSVSATSSTSSASSSGRARELTAEPDPAAAAAPPPDESAQLAASRTEPSAGTGNTSTIFTPRRPCNAVTLSLVRSFSNPSPDAPLETWLSPSPPLPPSAPLSARLDAWLAAPLAPPDVWARFSAQTCNNPSVRRNANALHVRESEPTWARMGIDEIKSARSELVGVLRTAEAAGRLEEWNREGKRGTRGLVWTAGNADTFDRVLTSLRLLRHAYNCTLAAQVFHFPSEAPSTSQVDEFAALNATVSALSSVTKDADDGRTKAFHLKGAALVDSAFDEVLLLDSDNFPVRDVAPLFDSPEFREMGVVLWPDFFKDQPENAIWSILGIQCRDEWTTESGQLLVRKSAHLDALLLVEHMLRDWRFWFRFSDGDKDLFRYAFLALRKRWAVPARHLSSASWRDLDALGPANRARFAGHSMLQHGLASEDGDGRVLFVHANLLKRVLADLHEGNTFGRTLRLRHPPSRAPPSSSSSTSSKPFLLTADALANVSPLTGLGILLRPTTSTSMPPPPPPPWGVRARALLARGLDMRFWDAHWRGGSAYVLAVESRWEDELAAPPGAWAGAGAGAGEEGEREGERERERERDGVDEWRAWVAREREAMCAAADGDGDGDRDGGADHSTVSLSLREELFGPDDDGGDGVGAGSEAAGSSMTTAAKEEEEEERLSPLEIVDWADDPDLRDWERLYYGVGRGKAGGTGFRGR
ncbi:hypothetical protein JCM3770_003805 [Rhodotorula araucariae]